MPRDAGAGRGRGGKFKKYTRGGGHSFSRDLQPVDADGNRISMWAAGARNKNNEDDDDEETSSEEDSSDEDDSDDGTTAQAEGNREDRKALKKARKEAAIARQKAKNVEVGDLPSSDEDSEEDEDMPANPNHSKAARKMAKAAVVGKEEDEGVEDITQGVSKMKGGAAPANRKEKESFEAKAAKEKYMKLHTAGKTDEAKADLARLKLIREQREAEAARRQAEKEEREAAEATRKNEMDAREAKRREAAAGPKKVSKKK